VDSSLRWLIMLAITTLLPFTVPSGCFTSPWGREGNFPMGGEIGAWATSPTRSTDTRVAHLHHTSPRTLAGYRSWKRFGASHHNGSSRTSSIVEGRLSHAAIPRCCRMFIITTVFPCDRCSRAWREVCDRVRGFGLCGHTAS